MTYSNCGAFRRILLAFLPCVALFASPPRAFPATQDVEAVEFAMVQSLRERAANDMQGLVDIFSAEQRTLLTLTPPGGLFTVRQSCGMVVFDPASFPEGFNKGLVGLLDKSCPVYTVTMVEDPVRNEIVFYNADGLEFWSVLQDAAHDPYWQFHRDYPSLDAITVGRAVIDELLQEYSPSRIQVEFTLLPANYAAQYAEFAALEQVAAAMEQAAEASLALEKSLLLDGMLMMEENEEETEFRIISQSILTNTANLAITYPTSLTNLDVFACSDLVGFWWEFLAGTNVDTSTNCIRWALSAPSYPVAFLVAGDGSMDSDADGLTDAREMLMYHTSSTNTDTDADGLDDYYEVMTLDTDPTNPKTNSPVVWISYPANESRKVWLP